MHAMLFSGTGFRGEEGSVSAINAAVQHPTLSRLKPVPQSRSAPVVLDACDQFSRTGFSREEASVSAINYAVRSRTSSRLKPVPRKRAEQGKMDARDAF